MADKEKISFGQLLKEHDAYMESLRQQTTQEVDDSVAEVTHSADEQAATTVKLSAAVKPLPPAMPTEQIQQVELPQLAVDVHDAATEAFLEPLTDERLAEIDAMRVTEKSDKQAKARAEMDSILGSGGDSEPKPSGRRNVIKRLGVTAASLAVVGEAFLVVGAFAGYVNDGDNFIEKVRGFSPVEDATSSVSKVVDWHVETFDDAKEFIFGDDESQKGGE